MNAIAPRPVSALTEAAYIAYLAHVADCIDAADTPEGADLFLNTRPLDRRQVVYLMERLNVNPMALQADGDGIGWPLLTARVEWLGGRAPRFVWRSDDGVPALVTVLRDEDGHGADVVAMGLRCGSVGTLGGSPMLGAHDLAEEPVPVHRDAVAWLQGGRRGVVVLDRARGVERLRGCRGLVVADLDFGDGLQRAMTVKLPRISIREAA